LNKRQIKKQDDMWLHGDRRILLPGEMNMNDFLHEAHLANGRWRLRHRVFIKQLRKMFEATIIDE